MTVTFDREKQQFFIARRGHPWKICDMDGRVVANFPPYWASEALTTAVCMAPSVGALKNILIAARLARGPLCPKCSVQALKGPFRICSECYTKQNPPESVDLSEPWKRNILTGAGTLHDWARKVEDLIKTEKPLCLPLNIPMEVYLTGALYPAAYRAGAREAVPHPFWFSNVREIARIVLKRPVNAEEDVEEAEMWDTVFLALIDLPPENMAHPLFCYRAVSTWAPV